MFQVIFISPETNEIILLSHGII